MSIMKTLNGYEIVDEKARMSFRSLCSFILGRGEPYFPNFDVVTCTLTFPPDTAIIAPDGSATYVLTENNNTCSFEPTIGVRVGAVKFCFVKETETIECYHFSEETPSTTHILLATARFVGEDGGYVPFVDAKVSINCEYMVNGCLRGVDHMQSLCSVVMGNASPFVVDFDTIDKKITFPNDTGLIGIDGYTVTLTDDNRIFDFSEFAKVRTAMRFYFNKATNKIEVTPFGTNYPNSTHLLIATARLVDKGATISINAPYSINGNVGEAGKYRYVGEKINLRNTFNYVCTNTFDFAALNVAKTGAPQCIAQYKGYCIICFIGGGIAVYADDYSLYREYALSLDNPSDFHAANIFLYGTNAGSQFPYLYISETTGSKQCYVVSLGDQTAEIVGKLSFNGSFGTGTDYFDWVYDEFRKSLLLVGYDNYGASDNHLIIKDLGTITEELTKTYADSDVRATYTNHDMTVLQGGCFANGSLVYAGEGRHGEGLYFIDPYRNDFTKSFVGISDTSESEGVMFDGYNIYYLKYSGDLYKFYFY